MSENGLVRKNIRISKITDKRIKEQLAKDNAFISESEFIRTAINHYLTFLEDGI